METTIFKVTFADGCWIKAELPINPVLAFSQAVENFGAIQGDGSHDVAIVERVPSSDAAALRHCARCGDKMNELVTKWVVDALRPGDAPGWVYNVADEDFNTEPDALCWIERYRPYIGASRYHTRAVERCAA